jgi:hypothetical protein
MKDGKIVGMLVLAALAVWALTRKPKVPEPEVTTVPEIPKPEVVKVPAKTAKQPATDGMTIPLEAWQEATPEQISHIPVLATEKDTVGYEEYNRTPEPIAIGDTGFNIWGVTETGAAVVSQRDPGTYESWEWLF